ncbi:hypothetical protein PVA44_05115 [Entomospira nematocerorum]|uniref:Uncharacterized protein n=1 Tax=Entomospira nematocerorum TaxID=2719987 RepID=A0A968GBX4_9SPIO|nr:hypothetical protein [Entomospira nematocera]NIZ46598.1 hypothetical protein [Entomospira nematocera]WDI33604.1 hypothetical protein PVA44_05115 [Entomospira nematocera]
MNISDENIYDKQIKEYFKEVRSSYNNGNYRATMVMLYSVVMLDILYKCQYLAEEYNDEKAKDIINKIPVLEDYGNDKSPNYSWESTLLDTIKKTRLLDPTVYSDLDYLRYQRHLSAHPVLLRETFNLYTPHPTKVYGCIVSMLEGVLNNPPYFINNITVHIAKDLADNKEYYLSHYSYFQKYMYREYFSHMRHDDVIKTFRVFWKFVFYLSDDNCENNRKVNYHCLRVMMEKYSDILQSSIEENLENYYKFNEMEKHQLSIIYVGLWHVFH